MANSPSRDEIQARVQASYAKLYTLPREKMPAWLKRKLNLLDELTNNPLFMADINAIRDHNLEKLPEDEYLNLFRQLFDKYKIDLTLEWAVYGYVINNKIDMEKIQPNVQYISHTAMMKGPSVIPGAMYDFWAATPKPAREQQDKLDELLGGIHLQIYPGTSKQDLHDYIDFLYDDQLKPGLRELVNNPKRPRVRERSNLEMDKFILENHIAGSSAKQIALELSDKFGIAKDTSDILRTIRRLAGDGVIDHDSANVSEKMHADVTSFVKSQPKKTPKPQP